MTNNPDCLNDGKPCAPNGEGGCLACDDFEVKEIYAVWRRFGLNDEWLTRQLRAARSAKAPQ